MDYIEAYSFWKNNEFFDETLKKELVNIDISTEAGLKEIEDRFYKELDFGTGGIRGIMGAGTNRINKYTVGKVSKGFGNYLLDKFGKDQCSNRGVIIAYDTRNNSYDFACTAANVLTAAGIKAFLFRIPVPTPQLSFSVRYFNCVAGVVVTASHNPKEYNGYKVYDETGCQLVPGQALQVKEYIDKVESYTDIDFKGVDELVEYTDTTDNYAEAVLNQQTNISQDIKDSLCIVYTPIHGTGYIPLIKILNLAGFENVNIVSEQAIPDGNFPTVKCPNPEEPEVLDMGISLAKSLSADIVLATDPDADRVGVAIKTRSNEYQLLTGNQIGALLIDYILSHKDITAINNPAIIKTVVTSELGAEIAKSYGCTVFDTLTGFKYIGEKINQFENDEYTFLAGYEESYGYLVGTYARDKDGIVSGLLLCLMAAEYKAKGITLADRLEELYSIYGYYLEALESFTLTGRNGQLKIQKIMDKIRINGLHLDNTIKIIDFNNNDKTQDMGILLRSNLIKYIQTDGSWVAIRPSGTEPKIKVYYSILGVDLLDANRKLDIIKSVIKDKLI